MLINPATIRAAIDTAPAWAKIAISIPQDKLRKDGEAELATHLYHFLFRSADTVDGQLPLPF